MKRTKVVGLKYLSLSMHTTNLPYTYGVLYAQFPLMFFSSEFAKLSDIVIVYTYTLNGETEQRLRSSFRLKMFRMTYLTITFLSTSIDIF